MKLKRLKIFGKTIFETESASNAGNISDNTPDVLEIGNMRFRKGSLEYNALKKIVEEEGVGSTIYPHVARDLDSVKTVSRISLNRSRLRILYNIVYAVPELRAAVYALRRAVFRRGGEIVAKFSVKCEGCEVEYATEVESCETPGCFGELRKPDLEERQKLEKKLIEVNAWGQSLISVLREIEEDLNIADDGFIVMQKTYQESNGELLGRVISVTRHAPDAIEYVLDEKMAPGRSMFLCPVHRINEQKNEYNVLENPGSCPECGCELRPVYFKASYEGGYVQYLFRDEVIHASKFSPSKLYGYSPVWTVLNIALAIYGADEYYYATLFERKLPRGMIVSVTADPNNFKAERNKIIEMTKADPNATPWAIMRQNTKASAATDTKWVPLGDDATSQSLGSILNELRGRIALLWGVATTGATTATETIQQVQGQLRTVEDSQTIYNIEILPALLEAWGINDWVFQLVIPEERQQEAELARMAKQASIAEVMYRMGFEIYLDDNNIAWRGESKSFNEYQQNPGPNPSIDSNSRQGGGLRTMTDDLGVGRPDTSGIPNRAESNDISTRNYGSGV